MSLRWEGQIASTSETGEGVVTINGRLYSDHSRTNNTLSITNIYVGHQASSGVWWDWEWQADAWINSHNEFANRQSKGRTGLTVIGGNWYYTSSGSYNLSVGTGSGTYALKGNWESAGHAPGAALQTVNVSYPAAGSPTGTTGAISSITTTSMQIRNDVTSWGAYCTAGSVRSYRADNSGFSGQVYIGTTDNALVTHSGLTSNDEYWFRGWMSNGAGLSAYMGSTRNAVTLPLAPVISSVTSIKPTRVTIATTQNTGGGRYTITKKYRIKEVGGSYGSWTTYTGNDIEIPSLSPSTEYEVQVQAVTTAGTTDGGTTTFETKSASGNFIPIMMG